MAEALLPRWLRYKPVLNFPRFREAMPACAEDAAGAERLEGRTPATKDRSTHYGFGCAQGLPVAASRRVLT
jgi:hypothetical protein